MRGLVICWMLIGGLGFLIFPWYVTGDGFFSINWILEYSLEDYGSVLPQVFTNKKYWLLPLAIPLFFPLTTLKLSQNNPLYSKIFLYSGLIGFFYFFQNSYLYCYKKRASFTMPFLLILKILEYVTNWQYYSYNHLSLYL